MSCELPHQRLASRLADIDGDRPLAAVDRQIGRGLAGLASLRILVRDAQPAHVVAMDGMLDLDHVGAEIGQHLAGPGAGEHAAEIEHADMRQATGHGKCLQSHASAAASWNGRPSTNDSISPSKRASIAARVSWVIDAECGCSTTLSSAKKRGSIFGSDANTSSAAPAIFPFCSAAINAGSSTTEPRDTLMR